MKNVTPLFPNGTPAIPAPRCPLSSPQMEQSLLGALMRKPSLLEALPSTFSPDHYEDELHADIHRAIVLVGRPGVPAMLPVAEALAIRDTEGRNYVVGLVDTAISFLPDTVTQYADGITQLFRRRQLVAMADTLRDGAHSGIAHDSADGLIASAISRLDALTSGDDATGHSTVTLDEAMDSALRKADEAAARGGPAGLSTGFRSIDDRLGGMDDGSLIVLAGRPGMGKSSLGWQWAIHNARQGIGVLAISQEMSALQLGRAALSALSGVPVEAMKRGTHARYTDRLIAARKELHGLPISIEDGGGLRASVIALKARTAHRKHGLGLILVDHLHITPPETAEAKHGPTYGVGQVSGAMKRLAKTMNVPVLLLAQLNRGVENRDDKRPGLADLRQSGDIEQDADAVGFLYRAEKYMEHEPTKQSTETHERFATRLSDHRQACEAARGKAELIWAKIRDGEPGTVPLMFRGETTSFSEVGYEGR